MLRLACRIAAAAALAASLLSLAGTVLLAWQDHLARGAGRPAIESAIRLAPGNAKNYAALALLGGADRTSALESAVRLNRFDSKSWIELGLDWELRGGRARAERCLLEAARVDKTYAPRWTLANFYFRANDRERFLPWLREAARMSYGDGVPLARLAWDLAGESPEGLAALSECAPALVSYTTLLFDHGRLGPAEAAADRLIERGGREVLGPLLIFCDRLLEAGAPEAALRLWNRMAVARLIPAPQLDAVRGPWLTNGEFASEPLHRGFDWRIPAVEGVDAVRLPGEGALRFSLSGGQPEQCLLMQERIPVPPGRRWRLAFEYRTAGLAPETGVRWRTTGAEWQAKAGEAWSQAVFEFTTPSAAAAPPAATAAPLVLAYERAPGTVRTVGSIWLRRLRLEAAR
jgi:tetratricopeptide (TPR) repeat protein